jgi:membrane associated rhomboid family serine protease
MSGMVQIWELSLLVTLRQWERALAFYASVYDWGTLGLATQARLFAARALAETGQFERALRSLEFVLLSPRTVGARQGQLWATRVAVAALAGDRDSVDKLLRESEYARPHRRFARFAAYWRGRCALARGEFQLAVQMLIKAYGLTHPRNHLWREAVQEQLALAETAADAQQRVPTSSTGPAFGGLSPAYAHGQELLRRAEKDSAGWRALMHMGRPELVTLSLLLVFATVHLVNDVFLSEEMQEKLLMWAGNSADTVKDGEWWRLFTALFLHANLLHLAMNGAGLWLFGSAVEKTMGRWRMLVVFLAGGALGNLVSAFVAHYDVAIGASGGIFAVIGAFAVGVWRLRSPMYFALRRRLLFVLALMVAADFTIGGLEPQVDNLAHVGGFFAGILLAVVLGTRGERRG